MSSTCPYKRIRSILLAVVPELIQWTPAFLPCVFSNFHVLVTGQELVWPSFSSQTFFLSVDWYGWSKYWMCLKIVFIVVVAEKGQTNRKHKGSVLQTWVKEVREGSLLAVSRSAGTEQLGLMQPEGSPQDGLEALFVSPALEQRKIQKSFLCHLVALHRAHVWQRPVKWENSFLCVTEHPHGSHDAIFPNISIWAFTHS